MTTGTALKLTLLLLVQSCSVGSTLHVFNNTQVPISFSTSAGTHTAPPAASVSFGWTYPVEASIGDCHLSYNTPAMPRDYVRYIGSWINRPHIYAQVEPGGQLYLMLPEEEAPIDAASYPQPDGYPVTPAVSGDCDWQTDGDRSSGAEDGFPEPVR